LAVSQTLLQLPGIDIAPVFSLAAMFFVCAQKTVAPDSTKRTAGNLPGASVKLI
jgi:hypothetical protein